MARLFVYGSLKRGFSNSHLMRGARFVTECSTTAGYRLVVYEAGYPALVNAPSSPQHVEGELYELGVNMLAELNAFEGCPDLYQRELVPLVIRGQVSSDLRAEAFAYVIDEQRAQGWEEIPRIVWREEAD
jgi:gamma-glutamylaminecyclotransferase